jgi:endo-1,4-beta-xylanase
VPRPFTTVLLAALAAAAALPPSAQGQADPPKKPADKKPWPKAEWVDPVRTAPNGTRYQTFRSKALGADVSYLVYLPPGYEKGEKRYPVIYWLHGLGGNQRAGASLFVPHVEAAVRKGWLPPAIVVCVNGMVNGFYCDWAGGKRPLESVIVKDLVPHVDKTYRTLARREARVIQGYSMGGYGAAHLGFKYPEVFGAVVVDAGALVTEAVLKGPRMGEVFKEIFGGKAERFWAEHPTRLVEKNVDRIRGRTHVRVGVGKDDGLLPRNRELHELLGKLKVEHEYEVVPGVAHSGVEYYKKLGAKGFEFHRKVFEALGKGR